MLALWPSAAFADGATWEQSDRVPGVVDIGGPRSDGSMLVAGSAALYVLDASGKQTDFARGPGGYRDDAGKEAYVAVSPGGHVASAGCDFTRDETFILRQHVPFGVTRVSADGEESGSFANIPGVRSLDGLVFDTGGAFDGRLLVVGTTVAGKTAVFGVDCSGGVKMIAPSVPPVEGGLAIAPSGFAQFGGELIAPDPVDGRIYAIAANGSFKSVAKPTLDRGREVGVESLGFVPDGFIEAGGFAYVADQSTGHLLRISASSLGAAGARDGDLLAATEHGAALVFVRCDPTCAGTYVIKAPGRGRAEGHIVFAMSSAEAAPSPSPVAVAAAKPVLPPGAVDFAGQWGVAIVILIAAAAFGVALGARAVRRRPK